MFAAGSYLTVQASGATAGIVAPADLRNAIADELRGAGLIVANIRLDAPALAGYVIGWMHYNYSTVIVVQTRMDADTPAGAVGMVTAAITDQAGAPPDALTYQVGGGDILADQGVDTSTLGSASGAAGSFLGALQADAQLIILAIVVLVALIAFGPNIKSVLKVAR